MLYICILISPCKKVLGGRQYNPHFTDKKTEAQFPSSNVTNSNSSLMLRLSQHFLSETILDLQFEFGGISKFLW